MAYCTNVSSPSSLLSLPGRDKAKKNGANCKSENKHGNILKGARHSQGIAGVCSLPRAEKESSTMEVGNENTGSWRKRLSTIDDSDEMDDDDDDGAPTIDDSDRMEGNTNEVVTKEENGESTTNANSTSFNRRVASPSMGTWGWFQELPGNESMRSKTLNVSSSSATETNISMTAVTAPTYVLQDSISSQKLWKQTAGNRPPQPVEERAFFEQVWAQNFAQSKVKYLNDIGNDDGAIQRDGNLDDEAQHRLDSVADNKRVNNGVGVALADGGLMVLLRRDNVFGTTVSKSFPRGNGSGIDAVSVSIASYRVVESKGHGKYAQYLVIFCEGDFRSTVGVWKRYSEFVELSRKVMRHGHENSESCVVAATSCCKHAPTKDDSDDANSLTNAITSWRLLKRTKRWTRCLDAEYLSLKIFMLERFLHDILLESSDPRMLRDFVGVDPTMVDREEVENNAEEE